MQTLFNWFTVPFFIAMTIMAIVLIQEESYDETIACYLISLTVGFIMLFTYLLGNYFHLYSGEKQDDECCYIFFQ